MIEIAEGIFVNPKLVAVVKEAGEGKCALFMAGQAATDGGFLIDKPAVDAADEIDEASED